MIYNVVDRIITSSAFGDEEVIMMSFRCTKSGSSDSDVAYPGVSASLTTINLITFQIKKRKWLN